MDKVKGVPWLLKPDPESNVNIQISPEIDDEMPEIHMKRKTRALQFSAAPGSLHPTSRNTVSLKIAMVVKQSKTAPHYSFTMSSAASGWRKPSPEPLKVKNG